MCVRACVQTTVAPLITRTNLSSPSLSVRICCRAPKYLPISAPCTVIAVSTSRAPPHLCQQGTESGHPSSPVCLSRMALNSWFPASVYLLCRDYWNSPPQLGPLHARCSWTHGLAHARQILTSWTPFSNDAFNFFEKRILKYCHRRHRRLVVEHLSRVCGPEFHLNKTFYQKWIDLAGEKP